MTIPMADLIGYQMLELLYASAKTLVYRGRRCSDSRSVIIKLLRNEYPSIGELVKFRNQYQIAKSLSLPGIIQPYSLEPYLNGYALIMEDFGGISLRQWLGNRLQAVGAGNFLALDDFFNIALQLVEVLNELYQHRVIHKDIKPSNILINPETRQVKLTDFSLASLLARETQTLQTLNILEGTLAYLSPEQTGRMNRGIDYRTDFYSLGVTFYELLTGNLPFPSRDPMELVHCHIAKLPPSLQSHNPEIPLALSAIVGKLMAKNAEDRYQSALGLKYDLEQCQRFWREHRTIPEFAVGQRDVSDRLLIPEKLYGREQEVAAILAAFERVAGETESQAWGTETQEQGSGNQKQADVSPPLSSLPASLSSCRSELVLVAGYSGVGKTAIVNEVHKPIARQRGYFIKGKFDQFNRSLPFFAFVQAFRDLMAQLLSEPETALQNWKTRILAVLGNNGQVIIEVIPELERIIGPQPPVTDLAGAAAQNRFNLLFQKFIQVFTTPEHPLVIFLDDLQWADSASLRLMQLLLDESARGYLLLIGAYRDNEVSAAHPLVATIQDICKTAAPVHRIDLTPLNKASLNQLVADTLHCSPTIAQPFTELVYRKTKGNPFFSTQFLKTLYEEALISFNAELGYWQCDLARVKALALTDDVVELMARQLQKLPVQTQAVLKLAACIGNQFDLATLAIVCEQSDRDIATVLWPALQDGLILPQSEVYKFFSHGLETSQIDSVVESSALPETSAIIYQFLHDRVQQAAYSLIPETERAIAHYQIGQLLLQRISPSAREERIFELVNQLNYGIPLITAPSQRDQLAQLNLLAARKARGATAYQSACEYARMGLSLLGTDSWQTQYEMTLALHELAAEVASLIGDFEQMNRWIETVICQARTPLDQVQSYQIKIQALNTRNEFLAAIATGLSVLQSLGVSLPEQPTPEDAQQAKQAIDQLLGDRDIAELIHLPEMANPEQLAIVKIANSISPSCYMTGSPLYFLVIALQVRLAIQYGNTPFSPIGYVSYAFQLHIRWQAMAQVQQFGQLAYQLAAEPQAKNTRAATFTIFAGYIHPCTAHLKETMPIFQEAYQAALETGDLEFIVYIVQIFALNAFWMGQPLIELTTQIRTYHQHLQELKRDTTAKHYLIYWETALILLGESEETVTLRQQSYEDRLISEVSRSRDGFRLCIFYLHRFVLNFWLGDLDQAEQDAVQTRQNLAGCVGTVIEPVFYFYDSLLALARLTEATAEEGDSPLERLRQRWQQIQENQAALQHWAHHAPVNHLHKWQLVEAERYRVLKQPQNAIELYDLAIQGAHTNEYLHEEALANELAAQFYLNWGKERIAQDYLLNAYYGYAHWEAGAKVKDLEQRYSQLLQPVLDAGKNRSERLSNLRSQVSNSSSGSSGSREVLDLAAVIKASQAISGELKPDLLTVTLMQIVLENAGAEMGSLILLKSDQLVIMAQCISGQQCELQSTPLETSQTVPVAPINYAFRTAEVVVIDDIKTETRFAADPYLIQAQPKSVLCLPLLKQSRPMGVICLENHLTTGAFTSDHIQVLNLLCAQAVISFENASLYENLQISNQSLQRSLEILQQTQAQLVQATEKLQFDAWHDGLTHLPNRSWFVNLLDHAIQLSKRHPNMHYAVLFIDLDRFKMINDSLGHAIGDEFLKSVAQRLQTCLRTSDTIARFGGDEFAVLLEDLNQANEAIEVAKRIHHQVSLPFQVEGYEVFTTASIGIVLNTRDYQEAAQILRDADTAMYHAKTQGRNCYAVFDQAMQTHVAVRLQLESDLRRAIEAGEFYLEYQPIVSLPNRNLRGFEALVRWRHPTRGIISPAEFIPVAEETGLIVPLGWWILQESCEQLSHWCDQFPQAFPVMMNVNLSAIQLKQTDLLERLESILQTTQIPRDCLKLEITESCILEPLTPEAQRLKQLKDLGVRLCIDDFGTGYSSLTRLREFPIDTLKIDRIFVHRLTRNYSQMVQMIISLAHSLGIDVVAEGIETETELETLKDLGCEFGQGYLFSPPIDPQEATQWLRQDMQREASP